MAKKIVVTIEKDPWDAFLESGEFKPDYDEAEFDIQEMLVRYTGYLERKGAEVGTCLVCSRRFRSEKKGS
jgi:hypothetical protein